MHWPRFHGSVQGKIPQVCSLLRTRELRAMAPECVRNLEKEDLMELCLEELLGISSKRLCAILDGAEPPTDTSSSESEGDPLETVSLDSISSDELQQKDDSKKHKCKRKEEKSTKKSTKSDTEKTKFSKKHSKSGRTTNKSSDKSKDNSTYKSSDNTRGDGETYAAERAGMTVLELLELQARARAIRAQLSLEHSKKAATANDRNATAAAAEVDVQSDSDSVEIKEEPAQVVELLSSDEEDRKPDVACESAKTAAPKELIQEKQNKVTKKNDLTIIVPAKKMHRKVKLNRTKSNTQPTTMANGPIIKDTTKQVAPSTTSTKATEVISENSIQKKEIEERKFLNENVPVASPETKNKDKKKRIKKVKRIARRETNDGSDHDEITLQLSDSEKMDLLEDLDRKNYDNVTSSDDTSEEEQSEIKSKKLTTIDNDNKELPKSNETNHMINESNKNPVISVENQNTESKYSIQGSTMDNSKTPRNAEDTAQNRAEDRMEADFAIDVAETSNRPMVMSGLKESVTIKEKTINIASIQDIPIKEDTDLNNLTSKNNKQQCKDDDEHKLHRVETNQICTKILTSNESHEHFNEKEKNDQEEITVIYENKQSDIKQIDKTEACSEKNIDENNKRIEITMTSEDFIEENTEEKDKSEGEISDRASSEVEMFEPSEDIVCISDEEIPSKKKKKEKKKKEKKCKKEKKKDFREHGDQNFSDGPAPVSDIKRTLKSPKKTRTINSSNVNDQIRQISEDLEKVKSHPNSEPNSDSEEICEIYEVSDGDDSCYEVDGVNISKEPTCEEIEALSAKIDTEIEREDIITEEQIRHLEGKQKDEQIQEEPKGDNLEDISWKERYLDSSKVRKVLKTSSILNAMRKKNIELKKKLAENKKPEALVKQSITQSDLPQEKVEEGSIEHFNTLQATQKYIDTISEVSEKLNTCNQPVENSGERNVRITPENEKGEENTVNVERKQLDDGMKKDAKQLLKMYKRLLKYNNLEKPTDPNKIKKKKNKKAKKNKNLQ